MSRGRSAAPVPSGLFIRMLHMFLKPYLVRTYRLKPEYKFDLSALSPPYIVISNHVNFWDPFFINSFLPHTVQYVTSDNIFRTKALGLVMKLVGSIPKTKFKRDNDAVRAIFGVLRQNGVVGIFPEARRSWTGASFSTMAEVGRLIRKLKLPVVAVSIKGGYLSKPRWAAEKRTGRVIIEFSMLFGKDDSLFDDDASVHLRIQNAIDHDDIAFARNENIEFHGQRLAEYLERVLFLCPDCLSVSRLVSAGDEISCTDCGYTARYGVHGTLSYQQPPKRGFSSVAEWDGWQRAELERLVAERSTDNELIFENERATLFECERAQPMAPIGDGDVSLAPHGIRFSAAGQQTKIFTVEEIDGINVQNGEMLEFYYDSKIMRIELHGDRSCSYKWFRAVRSLRKALGFDDGTD